MEVGDDRFGRWTTEIPDRISFNPNPAPLLRIVIPRCEPLCMDILATMIRAILASQQVIDRC